jgi:deoxyadenosine/deoxycytidine kinase
MSRIIAISGSHGVGKTTLVKSIKTTFNLENNTQNVKIFNEINTNLFNLGLALNGVSYDFDEIMFSQKKAFDLGLEIAQYYFHRNHDKRVILLDRSFIDTYLYTKYFLEQEESQIQNYKKMLNEMEKKCLENLDKVYHILLLPLTTFDGINERMSISEQKLIWDEFVLFFNKNDHNEKNHTISPCIKLEDRVEYLKKKIIKILNEKDDLKNSYNFKIATENVN